MNKPTRKEDLIPQFNVIGEPGWEQTVGKILMGYELPLPVPISEEEIVKREQELGVKFNDELRIFLKAFGPVDFEGLPGLLKVEEIANLESIWFRDCLSEEEILQASGMIGVGDVLGSGDKFGLELATGNIYILEHDGCHIGLFLNSFSDLIKYGLVTLSTGYYAPWPDPDGEVEKLEAEALKAIFGDDF